ncbi:hypothetical protein [Spiroplasma ixodetis]|uniref:hypothetical protein n=1 Tax=Spiroplasma ixodetis TaxID=2141 RepID=UPI0025781831|nr:hypothetical protein [Spiroplasma ixodetis]WJG71169.1 hypothetical protein SIXOD_v1c25300 [Spiroplasma ixodetis Y32]
MALPQIPKALVTGGNSASEKAILSVIEAQVRGVLNNENTTMYFRTSAVAQQIETLNSGGMAIYRIAERIVWGSDYDPVTGITRQWTSAKTTTVILDQKLTINWAVEDFDMERFLSSDPNVRATLLAEWSSSMIKGYLYCLEAIFLTGIKDYCISKSQVLPINLLNLNQDSAYEAFYTIGQRNNRLIQKITNTEVGVNSTDILAGIGFNSYLQFTKVFQKLNYSSIAADTITTGKLYKDSIFGTDLFKSFYLEQEFKHGTETGLHLQKTFDLRKMLAAFIHKNAVAMPSSFQTIRQMLDNNTGNLKWIGKALYALPTMIRGHLQYIIQSNMPTVAEITEAQNKEYTKDTTEQKTNATYKLADFDDTKIDLENLIFYLDLGRITIAGTTPTKDELDTAVNKKNIGYTIGHADYTNIAETNATMTAKSNDTLYIGSVILKYEKA